MANALPILLIGGGALLLMGGKKKKKSSSKTSSGAGVYGSGTPAPGTPGSPAPAPNASKPTATKQEELLEPIVVEQMLYDLGYPPGAIDGGYDTDTETAVETFQMDWNSLMEWLWEHRDVAETDPKYGKIKVDGTWGPKTESRAIRAYDKFPGVPGAYIIVDEKRIDVENFRDSVIQAYAHTS